MSLFSRSKAAEPTLTDRYVEHVVSAGQATDLFTKAADQLQEAAQGLHDVATEARAEADRLIKFATEASVTRNKHLAAAARIRELTGE